MRMQHICSRVMWAFPASSSHERLNPSPFTKSICSWGKFSLDTLWTVNMRFSCQISTGFQESVAAIVIFLWATIKLFQNSKNLLKCIKNYAVINLERWNKQAKKLLKIIFVMQKQLSICTSICTILHVYSLSTGFPVLSTSWYVSRCLYLKSVKKP